MGRRRRQFVPPEPVELTIEGLSHEGRGIARVEGKTIFVEGALPNEKVVAQVQRRKKQFEEAKVLEVLQAAPDRVTPPCEHASLCGGCSLQHMAPNAQLTHKENVLKEQLLHFGAGLPEQGLLPPIECQEPHYRRKARLACKFVIKKDQVLVGFREKHSHFVANLDRCEVLHHKVGSQLSALKDLVVQMQAKAEIPQIEVAVGDKHVALVVRHLKPLTPEDWQLWLDYCQSQQFYLYLQPGGLASLELVWSPQTQQVHNPGLKSWEPLEYAINALGIRYEFHPLDFVQVNAEINEKLIERALSLLKLEKDETVLDLFCGLGNFSLPMAQQAGTVIGVEGSDELVVRAQNNAALNQLSNATFHAADLYRPELSKHHQSDPWWRQVDAVLVDPPRSGAEAVLSFITDVAQPTRMVYVACSTATLARDLKVLSESGYQLKAVGIADMFPHTAHVESIAYLERL